MYAGVSNKMYANFTNVALDFKKTDSMFFPKYKRH